MTDQSHSPSGDTLDSTSSSGTGQRETITQVVLRIAVNLLRLSDWRQDLKTILASLAMATQSARVFLVQEINRNGVLYSEWHTDSYPGLPEVIRTDSEELLVLLKNHAFFEPEGHAMNRGPDGSLASPLIALRVRAHIPWGWLAFESSNPQRVWKAAELESLQLAAAIFSAAIAQTSQARTVMASEIRLRTLFEQIPAIVYTAEMDEIPHITWISPQVEKYLGTRPDEYPSHPEIWLEQIYPEDRARVQKSLTAAIMTKSPFSVECRLLSKSGRPIWFRHDANFTYDTAGNPRFIQGVLQDIHQRKSIEAELNRLYHEEHLQRLMVEGLTITSSTLSATMDIGKIPDLLLQELSHILPYDTATFWFIDGDDLELNRARGYSLLFGDAVERRLVRRIHIPDFPLLKSFIDSGQPLILENVIPSSGEVPHTFSRHIRSWAGAPVTVNGKAVAMFTIESRESGHFTNKIRSILSAISGQASMSLQNALLFKTEQELRARAEMLQKATAALTADQELPQLLEQVMDFLAGVVAYDSVCLFLFEEENTALRAVAGRGFSKPEEIIGKSYNAENPLFSVVVQQKKPLILADTHDDPRFERWGGAEHISGWMCLPLIWREKVIGFMTVDSCAADTYNEEAAQYAQAFANQAASAIQISRLLTHAQALAVKDPLTGVLNRRHFFELAGQIVARASQEKQTVSAIMIDVDEYKKVNDTHGHLSGDKILRVVTECFRSVLKPDEILARMGGDEFIILLPGQDRPQAEQAAECLRSTLENAVIVVNDHPVTVTASFGVAEIDPGRMNLDDMINRADQALYQSKNAGRNTVS